MEGGNREEAERWLYTANKLLSARDLHGARSFAIRARECDPRFDATELLLAVIDTLMAGDARISEHLDWYAVLQVLRYTQNIDYIAAQYRRLAVLLDPHRNPFAFSAHAFTLVHDAWSVLSNPTKKAIFDNDLRLLTEPPPLPPPPLPPQPTVAPPAPAPILPQAFPILHNHNQQSHHHQNNQSLHQHHQNHHHQHQQVQEQEMFSVRRNPTSKEARVVVEVEERPSLDNVTTESTQQTRPARASEPSEMEVAGSFWTACPYCYVMYEYPKVYEECTLRCQSCQRGFHAVVIRSPPGLTGEDGSFCSWGFIPLGFSGDFKDISGSSSKWNPFSPLFPCPLKGASNRRYQKGPWVYYDDEAAAAFVELSDTTEDDSDDEDWRRGNKKGRKRARKNRKSYASAGGGGDVGRATVGRPRRGVHNNGAGNAGVENGEAVDAGGPAVPVVVRPEASKVSVVVRPEASKAPVVVRPEASKKAALGGSRRRGAGNLGKLDLNVEFSNEVEEPAHGAGERNGNPSGAGNIEDNIEGIGFFEGLDEFLSSLPILNVVADDKVKGH